MGISLSIETNSLCPSEIDKKRKLIFRAQTHNRIVGKQCVTCVDQFFYSVK